MATIKCKQCGIKKEVKKIHVTTGRAKFCSKKCKYIWYTGKKGYGGPKKTGSYRNCLVCGKRFWNYKSSDRKYCSPKCRYVCPKFRENISGKNNYAWKGGKTSIKGYFYVLSPMHPNKNSGGRVAEHRLVMEKLLGRYLEKFENVHHKNGLRKDNRIENLTIVMRNNHYGMISCPYCKKEFLIK